MQRSPGFTAQGEATRENIEQEGCARVAIRRSPMFAREEQVVYTRLLRLSRNTPGNRLLDHSSSSLTLSLPSRLAKKLVDFASRVQEAANRNSRTFLPSNGYYSQSLFEEEFQFWTHGEKIYPDTFWLNEAKEADQNPGCAETHRVSRYTPRSRRIAISRVEEGEEKSPCPSAAAWWGDSPRARRRCRDGRNRPPCVSRVCRSSPSRSPASFSAPRRWSSAFRPASRASPHRALERSSSGRGTFLHTENSYSFENLRASLLLGSSGVPSGRRGFSGPASFRLSIASLDLPEQHSRVSQDRRGAAKSLCSTSSSEPLQPKSDFFISREAERWSECTREIFFLAKEIFRHFDGHILSRYRFTCLTCPRNVSSLAYSWRYMSDRRIGTR